MESNSFLPWSCCGVKVSILSDDSPHPAAPNAMHDYGWSGPDAAAIQSSRAGKAGKIAMPHSFLQVPETEVTTIWTSSIEAAEKITPAGGWTVAEHFLRIAEMDPRMKNPAGQ